MKKKSKEYYEERKKRIRKVKAKAYYIDKNLRDVFERAFPKLRSETMSNRYQTLYSSMANNAISEERLQKIEKALQEMVEEYEVRRNMRSIQR